MSINEIDMLLRTLSTKEQNIDQTLLIKNLLKKLNLKENNENLLDSEAKIYQDAHDRMKKASCKTSESFDVIDYSDNCSSDILPSENGDKKEQISSSKDDNLSKWLYASPENDIKENPSTEVEKWLRASQEDNLPYHLAHIDDDHDVDHVEIIDKVCQSNVDGNCCKSFSECMCCEEDDFRNNCATKLISSKNPEWNKWLIDQKLLPNNLSEYISSVKVTDEFQETDKWLLNSKEVNKEIKNCNEDISKWLVSKQVICAPDVNFKADNKVKDDLRQWLVQDSEIQTEYKPQPIENQPNESYRNRNQFMDDYSMWLAEPSQLAQSPRNVNESYREWLQPTSISVA